MRTFADLVMYFLCLVFLGAGFGGFKIIKAASGAPQEIEGLILFLISAVALVGAGIIAALIVKWPPAPSAAAAPK